MEYRIPKQGECYRHFKGNRYQVLTIAIHTETQEKLVVYQGLYGDNPVYARPLEMFAGKIDKEKFPNVEQEYRFELDEDTAVSNRKENQLIMEFLDLDTKEEKMIFLQRIHAEITEEFLQTAAQSLDFTESGRTLEDRYLDLTHYLQTLIRYESGRLR